MAFMRFQRAEHWRASLHPDLFARPSSLPQNWTKIHMNQPPVFQRPQITALGISPPCHPLRLCEAPFKTPFVRANTRQKRGQVTLHAFNTGKPEPCIIRRVSKQILSMRQFALHCSVQPSHKWPVTQHSQNPSALHQDWDRDRGVRYPPPAAPGCCSPPPAPVLLEAPTHPLLLDAQCPSAHCSWRHPLTCVHRATLTPAIQGHFTSPSR